MRRSFALLLSLGLVACSASIQEEIRIAPGASERLLLAMHLGYAGAGEAKPPSEVHRIASKDELLRRPTNNEARGEATTASGKLGDYALTNPGMVAIVAAVDGSPRGGTLVGLSRGEDSIEALDSMHTIVLGEAVRYDSLKTGTDAATGTAFVEVAGFTEPSHLAVSTRYDLAPELNAVLVHTTFVDAGAHAEASPFKIVDELKFSGSAATIESGRANAYLASLAEPVGYLVRPMVDESIQSRVRCDCTSARNLIGLTPGAEVDASPFVYSRIVAPLERPDQVALSAMLATSDGKALGDLEIEISPTLLRANSVIDPGALTFSTGTDAALVLPVAKALKPGDRVHATLPAGSWKVAFQSPAYSSPNPIDVVVRAKMIEPVRVVVSTVVAPPPADASAM